MLIVRVNLLAGRTDEQKEQLHGELAQLAGRTFGVSAADVRTVLVEYPARHWGIGGVSVAHRRSGA